MTFVRRLASLLVLAAPALAAQSPKTIPVRDFFRNPAKAYFQVSQGGKYVSYTEPYQNRMNIVVRPVAGTDAKRITSITDRDINSYGWKGDDRLFFFKDSGGNENFHLFTVDRTGTKQTDLTPMPKVRVDLVDELIDNPTDVLVQMNRRDSTVFDVYRVNVVTGDTTMIARNPGNITGWVADHRGRIRGATTTARRWSSRRYATRARLSTATQSMSSRPRWTEPRHLSHHRQVRPAAAGHPVAVRVGESSTSTGSGFAAGRWPRWRSASCCRS